MDFLWALLFLLWYEALTLPLRAAIAGAPAPADVRRLLSRVGGPVLLVLPIWLLGHATGWGLSRWTGLALVAAWGLAALAPWRRGLNASRTLGYDPPRDGSLGRELGLDGLTALLFFGFVALRSWMPEMTAYPIYSSAAEKFMNAMMFWTSWHSSALPPEDYWLAGHPLTYYYWGHFHWAWVGRLGGFPAELGLNLAFARMVTLVFEASYLLARAAGLRMGWAALSGVVVNWAGNPDAVREMWRVFQTSRDGYNWAAYNFWGPSRAIADSVIDEFPAFSSILGDFHAHHLALPWIVGWLALTLAGRHWLASGPGARATGATLWLGLGLAAVLSNLWNLPLVGFVVGSTCLFSLRRGWRNALPVLGGGITLLALAAVMARLILGSDAQPLPVDESASFLERLPIQALPAELRSTLGQLFSMWGIPAGVLAGAAAIRTALTRNPATLVIWGFSALIVLAHAVPALPVPPGGSAWLWLAMVGFVYALGSGPEPWLRAEAGWMLVGLCAVLAGLELVFVDDAYGGKFERYNSYFKLSYPLWPVFLVGAFAAAGQLWSLAASGILGRSLVLGLRVVLIATLLAAAVYPVCAIPARLIGGRRGDVPPRGPTLSAVDFLAHRQPWAQEAPMLEWIRQRVPTGDTVAEGVGKHAYGYVGRVASLAGRPVPLGWAHHERQWRGRAGHKLTADRQKAVDALYRAGSPSQMRSRAAELGVDWILYGLVERERYGEASVDGAVLDQLKRTAPLAAGFPEQKPTVFLFDFRDLGDRPGAGGRGEAGAKRPPEAR